MRHLIKYYDESQIRQKKRNLILNESMDFVVSRGISNITFTDIAQHLGIERKTIYRYYSSKESIIVDIAYLLVTEMNEIYMETSNKVLQNEEKFSSIELIKYTLNLIVLEIEKNQEKFIFINDFDVFLHNLDHDSEDYMRYQEIITNFKSDHHYLKYAIEKGLSNGEIKCRDYDSQELIEMFEQSFHSYLSRILVKRHESKRYKLANIEIFIDILTRGLQ